jgi:hypothetical protein
MKGLIGGRVLRDMAATNVQLVRRFFGEIDRANLDIEVYWPTRLHNHQPHGDPIDLNASEAELLPEVARVTAQAGLPLPAVLAASIPHQTLDQRRVTRWASN